MKIIGATRVDATIALRCIGMILNEWRVQGIFFGKASFTRDIPRFVELYLKDRRDLDALVSERIRLVGINEGFADMIGDATQARNVITFDDVLAHSAARLTFKRR